MISTIYGLAWDILGDFGLFKNFYYFLIIENFVLRFFWIFDFPMVALNYVNFRIMESISGLLEIIRRYIWNYVRLENEHLYNVGQYRAVRDIFIAPVEERYHGDFDELEDKTITPDTRAVPRKIQKSGGSELGNSMANMKFVE
uniref:EXS domain-containing protein n=1 Tax=Glossina austeni TaxID=7395 RepID=A0A1A9V6M5_GLOAU